MILVENTSDFEFFSSNSAGAIQGNGYQVRNTGYIHISKYMLLVMILIPL